MNKKLVSVTKVVAVVLMGAGVMASCIRKELPSINVDVTSIEPTVYGNGIVKSTVSENSVTLYADFSNPHFKITDLDLKVSVSKNATYSYVDVKMDTTFTEYGGQKLFVPGMSKVDTTVVGEITSPKDFSKTRYIKVVCEREGVNEDDHSTQAVIDAQNSMFVGWEKDGKRTKEYVEGAHLYKIWSVNVLPAGIPTSLTFDNWYNPMGNDFQQPYEIVGDEGQQVQSNIWSSTNTSIALMAKTNQLIVYGAQPTDDVAPGVREGNKKALLLTSNDIRYTGTEARPFLAGCCFIGEYDGSDNGALTCTHVGLPFDKKPESLTFWYKFYPFTILNPNPYSFQGKDYTFTVPGIESYVGKQDRGFIRAVLYRSTDDQRWLNGETIRDPENENVVAYAEFAPEGTVDTYTQKTITFNYVKDVDESDLANWKYSLAIYFASSYDGFRFIAGANLFSPVQRGNRQQRGTELYIDEMTINCK